jgi:5'-nucleotidase
MASWSYSMKIVLTNDDGMGAPGLIALEHICAQWGETVIVAPDQCHSSMSHRVTTASTIQVDEEAPNRFRVHGTPVDCTRLALSCLAPDADWVFSGINRGGNLGADTYISGTVAAAREAALLGVPAIAISHYVGRKRDVNWATAETRAVKAIEHAIRHAPCKGQFWNINLPHPVDDEAECEVAVCPLDFEPLQVRFEREAGGYRYSGDYHGRPRTRGYDVEQCFAGKIAVTLIPTQFTRI